MKIEEVISSLPYEKPFLFVDGLEHIDDSGVIGHYTFREDEYFYKGHFIDHPITPGVILIECCAQIGVVCLAIFLENGITAPIAFTNSEIEFSNPVYPGQKVIVTSIKKFYRLGKLKCNVMMHDVEGNLICRGSLSGVKMDREL